VILSPSNCCIAIRFFSWPASDTEIGSEDVEAEKYVDDACKYLKSNPEFHTEGCNGRIW